MEGSESLCYLRLREVFRGFSYSGLSGSGIEGCWRFCYLRLGKVFGGFPSGRLSGSSMEVCEFLLPSLGRGIRVFLIRRGYQEAA